MPDNRFDLIIIGAGPGGYVAAIRAAQLGMKVAIVEKRGRPGGVCLNEGCIPSKALLDSSELFALARDRFSLHGILTDPPRLDLAAMMNRKDDIVKKLTDGISYLFKKNGVTVFYGNGSLAPRDAGEGEHRVEVAPLESGDEPVFLVGGKILLATGSEASPLPGVDFDGRHVINARDALSFLSPPGGIVIAGAGAIGLELGSVWRRLGAEVTVIEMLPTILPMMDRQISDTIYRSLRKQGMKFRLSARITSVEKRDDATVVAYSDESGEGEEVCDTLLVSVGRRPLTAALRLEEAGVRLDEKGRVIIDHNYESSVPGIYAIGDIVPGPMLAHKASEEGIVCVERMAGHKSVVEYSYIPGVVYTWPEAAGVGMTEEELKEKGIVYKTGKFSFAALGRARCMDETEGFVKIIADAATERVLGIHMVGARSSDMIAEGVAFMSFSGTARDMALTCHAHPTLSEAFREAALDVYKEALHI